MANPLPINMTQGMSYIITTHYFFSSILLKRPLLQEAIKTASMDVHGNIRFNPEWTAILTVQECVFLLCHECFHYMLCHCLRRGKRDPDKWNWAADAWINETLIAMRIGTMIEGGVRYPGAENMTVEQLYLIAPDDLPKGEGGGSMGNDIDDSGAEGMEPAEASKLEGQAKVTMAQAARAAQSMDGLDPLLKELVDSLLHVKTPWFSILEQFMTKTMETDYSWYTPDREFLSLGLYLPGLDGQGCGELAIITDESGSISPELVNYFGGHTNTMLTSCQPEKVYVVHTTNVVVGVDEYTPDQFPVKLERRGRGSTDMTAGIKWVLKNAPNVDAIIVLTDGLTPFGKPCSIPIMWAITTNKVAPHGQTIKVDPNDG